MFLPRPISVICLISLRDIEVLMTFPIKKTFSFCFLLTALWQGKLFGTDYALQQKKRKKKKGLN